MLERGGDRRFDPDWRQGSHGPHRGGSRSCGGRPGRCGNTGDWSGNSLPIVSPIDNRQRAPDLTSYLQEVVDENPEPGRFVLTGSQHFGLTQAVSQSLAGRVGVLYLLPPGLDELARFGAPPRDLLEVLWTGAYPRIHDRRIPPDAWLRDYFATYVERDVRSLRNVTNLEAFSAFVRTAAGRTASEVSLSALASDVGVRHNTIRAWLTVLEASFLVFRMPAYRSNVRKRQIKAPKLHFLDSGLACHLLGTRCAAPSSRAG